MDLSSNITTYANAVTLILLMALVIYGSWTLQNIRRERKKQAETVIVLIDGENMPSWTYEAVDKLLERRQVEAKRIYADWGVPAYQSWRPIIRQKGLDAINVIPVITGKNASDIVLMIDAVEIATRVDRVTFVIASSDSDYVPLYRKLKQLRHRVVVVGMEHTPASVRNVVDEFVQVISPRQAAFREENDQIEEARPIGNSKPNKDARISKPVDDSVELLRSAWRSVADQDGWAYVSDIGRILTKREQIESAIKGKSLSAAIKDSKHFETRVVENRMQARCIRED